MYVGVSIPVPESFWDRADTFARQSIDSRKDKIARRRQTNTDKILSDIRAGGVSELVVSYYFNSLLQIDCTQPDFEIYDKTKKSFAPDLTCAFGALHIKTYTNPKWSSWVFQYGERGYDCDPLVREASPDNYLVLTYLDLDRKVLRIEYVLHQPDILTKFKQPVIPRLRSFKRVLYPNDIHVITGESGELLKVLTQYQEALT